MPGSGKKAASLSDPIYVAKMFYTYEADVTTALAPAASTTTTFNIDGDSDFFWMKTSMYAMVADDGTVINVEELPGVTLLITNTTNGRAYSSNPVPAPNMTGSGRLPFILPQVTYWAEKTTIRVDVANITDNKTYSDLRISFHGIKAFAG